MNVAGDVFVRGKNQLRFLGSERYAKMGAAVDESTDLVTAAQHHEALAQNDLSIGDLIAVAQNRANGGGSKGFSECVHKPDCGLILQCLPQNGQFPSIITLMQTLYDSDTFTVTHILANLPTEGMVVPGAFMHLGDFRSQERPVLARHGFEIVDKRSGKEVFLDGSWAEFFQQHIVAWQINMPSQEEVEETISQYADLAQNPVRIH